MKRITITGADLTGKTSLLKELHGRNLPNLQSFFSPKFHENEWSPVADISRVVEKIGQLANARKDPFLKAFSLFLGMTLFPSHEREYGQQSGLEYILSERHCLVDSMAYMHVYRRVLSQLKVDFADLKAQLEKTEADLIFSWIQKLGFPEPQGLIQWLQAQTPKDEQNLYAALKDFFRNRLPDKIILLQSQTTTFEERMRLRQNSGRLLEPHENTVQLVALQKSFVGTCEWISAHFPETRLEVLNTDNISSPDIVDALLKANFGFERALLSSDE